MAMVAAKFSGERWTSRQYWWLCKANQPLPRSAHHRPKVVAYGGRRDGFGRDATQHLPYVPYQPAAVASGVKLAAPEIRGKPLRSCCRCITCRGMNSAMVSPTTSTAPSMSASMRRTSGKHSDGHRVVARVVTPWSADVGMGIDPQDCQVVTVSARSR